MHRRKRSNRLVLAVSLVSLAAAIAPAAISINMLLFLRGEVAALRTSASGANQAIEVLEIASNIFPTFSAIAFDLTEEERMEVLRETDLQLSRLKAATETLLTATSVQSTSEERAQLSDAVEDILHSWAEIRADTSQQMTEFEKGYHTIKIMDQLRLARAALTPMRNKADKAAQRAALSSTETIAQTTALIIGVLIASSLIGVASVAGFIYSARSMRKSNADLEAALIQAEAADRAKSDFLATMSHEIRTPMNGVLGMADLLQKMQLDDRAAQMARVIQSSGKSLMHILDGILDYSKIEAGKLSLENSDFALRDLVSDAVHLFSGQAEMKGISLSLDITGAEGLTCRGDSDRLRQVLANLIGNAVKFTSEGGVSVAVLAGPIKGGLTEIAIEIADTGVGIAEEDLDKIFKAFEQVDGGMTRQFGGTGLGLSISNQLIRMMGGALSVRSELGAGAAFSIRLSLPALRPPDAEAEKVAAARTTNMGVDPDQSGARATKDVAKSGQMGERQSMIAASPT